MASLFFFRYAGATFVGVPVLAKGPLGGGPRELGLLFTASGLGALLGGMVAGAFRTPRRGLTGIGAAGVAGILLAAVALTRALVPAAALLLVVGGVNAWMGVTFIPLVQARTRRADMGRVMALLLFGVFGLYPFS